MLRSVLPIALVLTLGSALPAQTPEQIETRVETLLAKLTPEQKLDLIGGHNGFYTAAEPTIGLPALRMSDGPVGLRNAGGPSTAYPAGIALAATFDAELAFDEGTALGRDARSRGVHFLLGPGVNLYRAPMNGRNFEYFGEDPFLAARMAVSYIEGVQSQHVAATVKHFALNNEEYDRHHLNSVVDERTLHELYLPAFEFSVTEAHVGAIMTSYNLVNGVHASQNSVLNNDIAKGAWHFPGIIMSDWTSVYSGTGAALGGLDLEMPSAKFMTPANLTGKVPQSVIDDKVRRLLRVAVSMGWLDHEQKLDAPTDDPTSRAVAQRAALESITLLKNEASLLPLDASKLCTLAVIGPNADAPVVGGGGSAKVTPLSALSTVEALRAALPAHDKCGVSYTRGIPTMTEVFKATHFNKGIHAELFRSGTPTDKADESHDLTQLVPAETKKDSPLHAGRWTADFTPTFAGPQIIFLAVGRQDSLTLTVDGKQVLQFLKPEARHPVTSAVISGDPAHPLHIELSGHLASGAEALGLGIVPAATFVSAEAKSLAARSDAVLIAAGFDETNEGEGFDRTFALPGGQDELITQISALNKHTILTVNSGGGIDMPWLAQVPALLHLWYGGEESAPALAEVLFGKHSPEGHLPISIERSFSDNPTHDSYFASDPANPAITLSEGVFLGYRYYSSNLDKPQPLFPFGFGLSYTTFAFSHLQVENTSNGVVVSVDVKNTGSVTGGEAVQVYVGDPSAAIPRPAEELKAFRKIHLEPKESQHLQFTLDRRAFAYWSIHRHDWRVDPGKFTISVGDSSTNLPLITDLTIGPGPSAAAAPAPASSQAPFYNGSKEYGLTIEAAKLDYSTKTKDTYSPAIPYKTRLIEQLAGFIPKPIPLDKWGGRTDITAPATGYFYTKKIGDRWWAIDPLGNAYFHQAVVAITPNNGPNGKAALDQNFSGDKAVWMAKTHAFLLQEGIHGAGAWSDTTLIRNSPLQSTHPIAYTVNLDVMSNYGKHRGGMHADVGHAGYLNDTIFAFDPEWPAYADEFIKKQVEQYKGDPALFGYFSDNEMPIRRPNLEHYLDLPHTEAGYKFAKQFMDDHHTSRITDELAQEFLGLEMDHYAAPISAALKKYDPHHMYIGCRITGLTEKEPTAIAALGKYADAISVNYYNAWTPDLAYMAMWEKAAQKPIMITEWYVKGRDSGMPNKTGAGWLVASQAQRGAFYQNYALALIESKNVIGWHWFKYQDNDPDDPHAEASNKDANKGIVNIRFQPYIPLTERIRQLNNNAYSLADYFDSRKKP